MFKSFNDIYSISSFFHSQLIREFNLIRGFIIINIILLRTQIERVARIEITAVNIASLLLLKE